MSRRPQTWTIAVGVGALLGLVFAGVSTYDFALHLDRQVHDVHCSFIPGVTGPEQGESGCQVTLVSSYSSVFRTTVWGGVPISLPAMAVFAVLLAFAAELFLTGRERDRRATALLAAATAVPAVTSLVMAYISVVELDAVCKLCMGIYVASAVSAAGGVGLWLRARRSGASDSDAQAGEPMAREPAAAEPTGDTAGDPMWAVGGAAPLPEPDSEPRGAASGARRSAVGRTGLGYLVAAVAVGVAFVVVPVVSYVAAAPDHSRFIGQCGALAEPADDYGVMIPLDANVRGAPAIEILDPLCPACKGFEARLAASGFAPDLDRRAVLFPLDNTCNWMVDSAVHPGACAVSEAMLCADATAATVLEWAFANQERIRTAAASDPAAAARLIGERFPELARCVGSPKVRARLNRSLRWAVSNRLPVLTPQLYVGGVKLCDEDVDLGLDFALDRMIAAYRDGTLWTDAAKPEAAAPRAPAPAAPRTPPARAPTGPPGAPAGAAAPTLAADPAPAPDVEPAPTTDPHPAVDPTPAAEPDASPVAEAEPVPDRASASPPDAAQAEPSEPASAAETDPSAERPPAGEREPAAVPQPTAEPELAEEESP